MSPEYEAALAVIQRYAGTSNPAVSKRRGIERQLSVAYQQMVRAGSAPQIKGKYR